MMGACAARVLQEEMGLINGRQRDGLLLGQKFVSYFQIEAALLDYPGVIEAGAIADCENGQDPIVVLKIFLALDESAKADVNYPLLNQSVVDFIRQSFAVMGPIVVQVRDKLPMTRSGKILRNVLKEWS
ncbi:MAG: AMP-binding enzyme [Desulfitobacteriaceae bacterium]